MAETTTGKAPSKARLTTLAMVQIALCTALMCVAAQITIPLPIGVPFTLQVMMVILIALILKPLYALIAQSLYTLLGIIGLPVFAGGKSGVGTILAPTGGFIIGFIIAAMVYVQADLWSAIVTLTSVFILIDIAKCVIASLIAIPLNKALSRIK